MDNPIISFKNVSKEYTLYKSDSERFKALFFKSKKAKINKALKDVTFEINAGESVGLIGDNGAGKSTILKHITGVAFPSEGEVFVGGKVAALLELTAGFSMEMTGRENIYLKGYILGLTDKEIKSIEEKVIDFAELGDYIDQPVRTYSSGMKLRLGFAINVNIEPDVLVIDEALSVGDSSFADNCLQKVDEFKAQGKTIVFVSHAVTQMTEFCDRIVWINQGKLVGIGTPDEIIKPYCGFAREFNGMTNDQRKAVMPDLLEYQKKYHIR